MRKSNWFSNTAKKVLAIALSAAMTVGVPNVSMLSAAAADTTESTEVKLGDAVVDTKSISEKTNNATIAAGTLDCGISTSILTLGEAETEEGEESEANGVLVTNPFAGKTELQQTLADALKNANAVLAGDFGSHLTTATNSTTGATYYQLDDSAKELTYPMPEYTNGVSISLWAKMPKDATEDTTLLTFYRYTTAKKQGALEIKASGDVCFQAGSNSNDKKNAAIWNAETDSDVLANAGKWVYVTVSIENDEVTVYFDGEKASNELDSKYKSTNSKTFNKGFGANADSGANTDTVTTKDRRANYRDLFINFTTAEVDAFVKAGTTAGADVSKFEYLNAGEELLVDWLTDEDTVLYLGAGATDGKTVKMQKWLTVDNGDGTYSYPQVILGVYDETENGLQLADVTFAETATDANGAVQKYREAKGLGSEEVPDIVDETFDEKDEAGAVEGVVNMNADYNGSKVEEVVVNKKEDGTEVKSNVLTLGAADADDPVGVEVYNQFKMHTEFNQTLTEALVNADAVLSGDIKGHLTSRTEETTDADGKTTTKTIYGIDDKYGEDLVYPTPEYTNGLSVSLWAKMPEDATIADRNAVILSFSRNTTAAKQGNLVLTAGGDIGFVAGSNGNNYTRNTVVYHSESDESLIANAGEWVYVTLAIENDGLKLYYNGQEATLRGETQYAGTAGKMFNKGFGAVGFDETKQTNDPTNEKYGGDRRGNYRDLFMNFTEAEIKAFVEAGTTEGADVTKFEYLNSAQELLVDWLTDEDTRLFIGGDSSTTTFWNKTETNGQFVATYNASVEGLQVDSIKFGTTQLTAEDVTALYEAAVADDLHATGYVADATVIDEYIPFDNYNYIDITAGTKLSQASITSVTVNEQANADGTTTETSDNVLSMTSSDTGVPIVNAFAGHTELSESLSSVLDQVTGDLAGSFLTAATYDSEKGYWKITDSAKMTSYPSTKITYKNGISISAWVEVPETTADESVVFAFQGEDKTSSLYMTTTGSIGYKNGEGNEMVWTADGNSILANAGNWVYVTATITNNDVQVYFNGEAATMTVDTTVAGEATTITDGKTVVGKATKFNYGLGAASYSDALVNKAVADNLSDLLKGLTSDETTKIFSDGKVTVTSDMLANLLNTDGQSIIDFVTSDGTKLYLAGAPAKEAVTAGTLISNACSAASVGVLFDDVQLSTALDAAAAADAYEKANVHYTPVTDIIDFETNDDILALNDDVNGAKVEEVEINADTKGTSKVLTFGETAEEGAAGVKLTNILIGESSLNETLVEGLVNADAKLTGDLSTLATYTYKTVTNDDGTTTQVPTVQLSDAAVEGVTYPTPSYCNGVLISAWAKLPEDATEDTSILTFSRKTTANGTGALTVKASGEVAFMAGSNGNNNQRNAMIWTADTDTSVLAKAGEWVYVSVAIENDGVSVYFDGQKIETTLDSNYTSTNGKMFNRGFGAVATTNSTNDPATNQDRRGNYRDLLVNFDLDTAQAAIKAGTTEGLDVSKFTYLNSSMESVIEWLTSDETELYAGGTPADLNVKWKDGTWVEVPAPTDENPDATTREEVGATTSQQDAADEGLMLDDISIYAKHNDASAFDADAQAAVAYASATLHKTGYVAPSEEPTEEPTATPEATEEATATPEATEEATATPEATEEATATPEATEEATATPEVTEEPTAEPTAEPTETPSAEPTETTEPVTYYYGDVDLDGAVEAEDALAILSHVVKLSSLGEKDSLPIILADADHSGEIGANDALVALQVVVKLQDAEVYTGVVPVVTEETAN